MPESAHNSKIRRACDGCRKKRTKCDATDDNIPCSVCVSKQSACTYNEHGKKTGIPKGYVNYLEERMRNLESLAAKVVTDNNLLKQIGPSFTLETWLQKHNARSTGYAGTGSNLPMSSGQSTPAIYSAPEAIIRLKSVAPAPYDNHDATTQDQTADNFFEEGQMGSIGEQARGRYHGSASTAYLIKTGRDIRQDVLGYDLPHKIRTDSAALRPKFWNADIWEINSAAKSDWSVEFHFPPKDLGYTLVDLFFTNFIPHYPLFDRTSYFEDFTKEKYKTSVSDAAIYLMICAIASKWSTDPRVCVSPEMSGGKLDFLSSGWKYYIQICSLPPPSPLKATTLQELQVAALAAFYAISTSAPQFSWHISGIGLMMAVDAGAHRRGNCAGNLSKTLKEEQSWKRVFWALTLFNKMGSNMEGWPTALHDEDIDADLPLEVDDKYWFPNNSEPPKQPHGKPSRITPFVLHLKLSQILGHLLGTIYSINKSKVRFGFTGEKWHQRILSELDSSMNKWNDSIPDHLKWNPSNPDPLTFVQSAMLRLCYNSLQIEIHRQYIPWLSQTHRRHENTAISEPSRLICVNAAKQISHTLQVLMERKVPMMPDSMKAAAMAGVMLTMLGLKKIQASRRDGKNTKVDLTDERKLLRNCVRFLEIASERWYKAGYASEILKDVATDILTDYESALPISKPIIDMALFPTNQRAPSDATSAEASTISSPSIPWTMYSNTSTAINTPPSSFDLGGKTNTASSLDPLYSQDPKDACPASGTLLDDICCSTCPITPQPPGSRSWEQCLGEEAVKIRSSNSMNRSGLRSEEGDLPAFDIPLFDEPPEGIATNAREKGQRSDHIFMESLPPFANNSSQLLAEEPSYMDMFNYLTQAGLGGGGNGMNMEGSIGYMKHMFQSLVPFDGVDMGPKGFSSANVTGAGSSELHQAGGDNENSSSYNQILPQYAKPGIGGHPKGRDMKW